MKAPAEFLVPGSGTAAVSDGDEAESDLDIEWSGAIATGATINFVYTGNNPNYGAFDSLQYAIDQKIGTIISSVTAPAKQRSTEQRWNRALSRPRRRVKRSWQPRATTAPRTVRHLRPDHCATGRAGRRLSRK